MVSTSANIIEKTQVRKPNNINKINQENRAFHDWYRFVLSFPPHLVVNYINDFSLSNGSTLLDPFCGTGTTLIEARLHGMKSYGIEANPLSSFVSSVKVNWDIDPNLLLEQSNTITKKSKIALSKIGIEDDVIFSGNVSSLNLMRLDDEENGLLLKNSISPLPLHKVLILMDYLREFEQSDTYDHLLLALANTLVNTASNLHFGPEVGVGKQKNDSPVIGTWQNEVQKIANDIGNIKGTAFPPAHVILADSRNLTKILPNNSIDAVITSPPYPNEKDYTRITRLESVILGFIKSKQELRQFKKTFIRSNTRNVYKEDDDDKWINFSPEIRAIANEIEARRIKLNKTSGFEKQYSKVAKLYFGGMARHLDTLKVSLRSNAKLAYVVGDQASFFRVKIPTGELLAMIAEHLGYHVTRIDLFRTRFSTTTKENLREEVVVFQWKGNSDERK